MSCVAVLNCRFLRRSLAWFAAAACSTALAAQRVADSSVYAVIPRPSVLTPAAGRFALTAHTGLRTDAAFAAVARRFAMDVERATGWELARSRATTPVAGTIRLIRVRGRDTLALGAEGYTLDVTPKGPREFAAQIRSETETWAKVIKAAGIRAD